MDSSGILTTEAKQCELAELLKGDGMSLIFKAVKFFLIGTEKNLQPCFHRGWLELMSFIMPAACTDFPVP